MPHPDLYRAVAAGPITISRPDADGVLRVVEVINPETFNSGLGFNNSPAHLNRARRAKRGRPRKDAPPREELFNDDQE